MLNKLEKIFVFLFIFSISFGFFVFRANAAIKTNIEIPPTAKINEPVQIKVSANDSAKNSILFVSFSINRRGLEDSYDCTKGTGNPTNNCEAVFTKLFSEGSYIISGFAEDLNGTAMPPVEAILQVTKSGSLPPPSQDSPVITSITPSPAPVGSTVTISGTNFCPNINFNDSGNGAIFDQTSIPGGKSIQTNPLPQSSYICDSFKVIVPDSLIADNNVKVSVLNIKGVSAAVNLSLQPPSVNTDPTDSSGKLPAQGLQVNWPNSPAGTSLNDESTLPVLIQYLYEWGIALGGLAVFIALIIAGIQYLTSFGDPISMKDAFGKIQSAFWGLLLLLSSWLILNTINPDLTTFRPLVVAPPVQGLGVCENDEYCKKFGIDFKCFEGFCALDLKSRLEINPCTTATVNGKSLSVDGDSYTVNIKAGAEFSVTSRPDGEGSCLGYLELYPRENFFGTDCGGDKQVVILRGTETTEEAGDTNIVCAKIKKVEIEF